MGWRLAFLRRRRQRRQLDRAALFLFEVTGARRTSRLG